MTSWKKVGQRSRESWKDTGGNQEEILSIEKFRGTRQKQKKDVIKAKASAKKQGERGETLKRFTGGLREDIGMKTYLHGPMDYAKVLKL